MSKIAVCLMIAAGAVACILFTVDPGLDLYISKLVGYRGDGATEGTVVGVLAAMREYNIKLCAALIGICASALVLRLVFPKMPMLVPARGACLILLTYLIGPGLLANIVLKDNWARPRPAHVVEFGGDQVFKPWWDPRGSCEKNCSFVSGEASTGFALIAIAVLVPLSWRVPAIALAIGFGLFVGLLRMAAGSHFMSDIVFAGLLTALVVWILHGLIYRWRATRVSETQAQDRLDAFGQWLRCRLTRPVGPLLPKT